MLFAKRPAIPQPVIKNKIMHDDFRKYAVKHLGMSSSKIDGYANLISASYISPTIIEERQLNVA